MHLHPVCISVHGNANGCGSHVVFGSIWSSKIHRKIPIVPAPAFLSIRCQKRETRRYQASRHSSKPFVCMKMLWKIKHNVENVQEWVRKVVISWHAQRERVFERFTNIIRVVIIEIELCSRKSMVFGWSKNWLPNGNLFLDWMYTFVLF